MLILSQMKQKRVSYNRQLHQRLFWVDDADPVTNEAETE